MFHGWYKSESSLLPDPSYIDPAEAWAEIALKQSSKIVSNSQREIEMKMFTSLPLYIVTALFAIGCVAGIVIPIFDFNSD